MLKIFYSFYQKKELQKLSGRAGEVILSYYPWAEELFAEKGWPLPTDIDRVYVIEKAQKLLGYTPSHNFDQLARKECTLKS